MIAALGVWLIAVAGTTVAFWLGVALMKVLGLLDE